MLVIPFPVEFGYSAVQPKMVFAYYVYLSLIESGVEHLLMPLLVCFLCLLYSDILLFLKMYVFFIARLLN